MMVTVIVLIGTVLLMHWWSNLEVNTIDPRQTEKHDQGRFHLHPQDNIHGIYISKSCPRQITLLEKKKALNKMYNSWFLLVYLREKGRGKKRIYAKPSRDDCVAPFFCSPLQAHRLTDQVSRIIISLHRHIVIST